MVSLVCPTLYLPLPDSYDLQTGQVLHDSVKAHRHFPLYCHLFALWTLPRSKENSSSLRYKGSLCFHTLDRVPSHRTGNTGDISVSAEVSHTCLAAAYSGRWRTHWLTPSTSRFCPAESFQPDCCLLGLTWSTECWIVSSRSCTVDTCWLCLFILSSTAQCGAIVCGLTLH